jgi:hypothetical protein
MKYSIVTACFGGYDTFKEPLEIDPDCEYIYVTDNPELKSDKWKIILLDSKYKDKSNLWKAFYVRYHLQEFASNDIVVWIDASIQINKSLKPIIEKFIQSKSDFCLSIHYNSLPTYRMLKNWFEAQKKNPKRAIDVASFERAKSYIAHSINFRYRGHAEAGFQIYNLKNTKTNRFRTKVWMDLLKIGSNGNPFRLDEVVLSTRLQSDYKILKIFKVCRQILISDYMTICYHNGRKVKIGQGCYKPEIMCKNSLYFYNSLQKINLFL